MDSRPAAVETLKDLNAEDAKSEEDEEEETKDICEHGNASDQELNQHANLCKQLGFAHGTGGAQDAQHAHHSSWVVERGSRDELDYAHEQADRI